MSLAKAVLTGSVVREPEKRFTSNNLAITTFAINISNKGEEDLVRVIATGKLAERFADEVSKDTKIVVEGRLQTNTAKTSNGEERKIVEVSAQNFEVMSGSAPKKQEEEILQFDDKGFDDLIGEDEIPF